ncbi:hypothetical protein NDU88_004566 [Pleurodeles waltl]|uniref:Uncharacterized protein n=1 Tax=Pleurodeles waltl TaxID=8319 RepID=A0AAV7RH82_PLEWA|nr:hypothetical protein NDU88_004566 [Pleurodeles waltl]
MREHRHKFKEGTVTPERKISKQHPVRCIPPLGDRFDPLLAFPEPPSSEELYEETEEALDWFFEQEPPLTAEEQEMVRTATLWTSQPKIYNSDIIAQLYSSLPLIQRRLASLYMTQHLMTLNRVFRPHQSALEDLLSKCTSLAFLQDPAHFLNIFLDARQEYHDEVARTLLRARNNDYREKEMYRQYPLREVHPRVNAANELQKVFVYTPLTKLEIMKMKEMVPPHSKDPVGFFKELTDVLTMGIYTLTDLTIIQKNLLPPGIYEKLRGQDWLVDNANLNWAALETNDNARTAGADIPDDVKLAPTILKVLPQLLTTRKEDWDAISACKQKPGIKQLKELGAIIVCSPEDVRLFLRDFKGHYTVRDLDPLLAHLPAELWATSPTSVGRMVITPHKIILKEGAILPRLRQYKMPPQAEKDLTSIIEDLITSGVVI